MAISQKEVQHIVALARLKLTDEELETYGKQLNDILLYMEKLNELDTSQVEPTSHVIPIVNVFRDDVVTPSLSSEEALANAPDRSGDFYRVPRIIE